MKKINHDDERLAALLGGRLEGPEREELLAHLLANDDDYHVFADTAAILQQAEEDEAAQAQRADVRVDRHPPVRTTLQPSARPGWRRWKAPRVIVPAVLVGLVVLVTGRGLLTPAAPGVLSVAASLEPSRQGVPEGLPPDFGVTRGDGAEGSEDERTAVRAGATLMDLTVAAQAGDTAATRLYAQRAQAFDPGGAQALLEIQARVGDPYTGLEPLLRAAAERLEERLGHRDHLRLGAWAEAARLAAHRQDAAFFQSDDTRAMLRRAGRLAGKDSEAQAALADIRAATPGEDPEEWIALEDAATRFLRAIGS